MQPPRWRTCLTHMTVCLLCIPTSTYSPPTSTRSRASMRSSTEPPSGANLSTLLGPFLLCRYMTYMAFSGTLGARRLAALLKRSRQTMPSTWLLLPCLEIASSILVSGDSNFADHKGDTMLLNYLKLTHVDGILWTFYNRRATCP